MASVRLVPYRALLGALRAPHLRARAQLGRELPGFYRLHFRRAARACGLLEALRSPGGLDELSRRLPAARPALLEPLLRLGVALGELSLRDGTYALRGRLARGLAADDGDPLAALVDECVAYHGAVFLDLPGRLAEGSSGDYLATFAGVIARSSRVFEPLVEPFVRAVVPADGPARLLEVGCGSGVYLRCAAERNPALTGIGVDLQAVAVELTRSNLAAWGLGDRFTVLQADICHPPGELGGPFDLVTLYNNIYYFQPEQRPGLLRSLRARLAPRGRLALVTLVRGNGVSEAAFDLILRSTSGCAPLPEHRELADQLRASGFGSVESVRLFPRSPLYGFVAGP